MVDEKIGVLKRVAPSTGGLVFEDEPEKWYNATATAKNYVKAELKGKRVTIRLADNKNQFSFLSINSDQPEKVPEQEGSAVETNVLSKDDYWSRKESRDLLIQDKIARHGALNSALTAIKISVSTVTNGDVYKPEDVLALATSLAEKYILPFVKKKD